MTPSKPTDSPTPAATGASLTHEGRHHIERPNAVPVAVFVAVAPDLPSGRRRAGITTRLRRTLAAGVR